MDSERLLPHAAVPHGNGRIAAVGPVRDTRLPKGTQRIGGRRIFLIPGLADMHVHLNVRGPAGFLKNDEYAALFLANGVTTVRNVWGNPETLAFRNGFGTGLAQPEPVSN